LAEFWMIEPEIAFAGLSDNTALAEGLLKLKYTFAAILKERDTPARALLLATERDPQTMMRLLEDEAA